MRKAVGWPIVVATALSTAPTKAAGCEGERAAFTIGKPFNAALAEKARRRSGASAMRRMSRSSVHTLEFRPGRLNLRVDEKGVIIEVFCG